MRFLAEHPTGAGLDELTALATAAARAGFDGVLVSELIAAAAVAARVDEVLVAAEVQLGVRHPIEVAEEAAVTDLASGGRLILVARPAAGAEARFAEELDVVRHALAPRPFRFEGEHLTVPANLPENVHLPERLVRVTPAPAQPRLEIWGAGAGRGAALERALGYLAGEADEPGELAAAWAEAERSPASIGAPRARRETWTSAADLLARLRDGRASFGQDWACVAAPPGALAEIGSVVRPRIQIDRLTPGLEEFWDRERPWES